MVVQLGSSLTGKRVLQWQGDLTSRMNTGWWIIVPGRLDPAQHRGRRLLSSVELAAGARSSCNSAAA
ncbi:hypothetical protein CPA58_29230 [Klebsiella pneumoniae]|nr:hypothetical protein CPA58_29230 [Klebsiella pneumoniae]